MHELGIVFHIIKTVERVSAENGLEHVNAVVLELGEVSGVVPDYLTDCWRWAADKTELMKGSELKIETLPAVTHCDGCGRDYPTVEHGRTCPHCQSGETWLLTGNEVSIKELEAV